MWASLVPAAETAGRRGSARPSPRGLDFHGRAEPLCVYFRGGCAGGGGGCGGPSPVPLPAATGSAPGPGPGAEPSPPLPETARHTRVSSRCLCDGSRQMSGLKAKEEKKPPENKTNLQNPPTTPKTIPPKWRGKRELSPPWAAGSRRERGSGTAAPAARDCVLEIKKKQNEVRVWKDQLRNEFKSSRWKGDGKVAVFCFFFKVAASERKSRVIKFT